MIIGGQAVLVYGEPRLTRDIDVILGVDVDKLPLITAILDKLKLLPLPKDLYVFARETHVLPTEHKETGVRADFIFSFSHYEQNAIARSQPIPIEGVRVFYASAEDVIIHEMVAGRPRDHEDVKGILARQSGLDQKYLLDNLQSFADVVGRDLVKQYRDLSQEIR